ncbi:MAG: GNAT family N-acetyltransferase [Methanobacteriota archaeon]
MAERKRLKAPRLETARLVLRPITRRDIPFLLKLFGRPETLRYVRDEPLETLAQAQALYDEGMRPVPTRFRLVATLRETGEPIGTLGMFLYDAENGSAHIGYDLLKEHWGNRYMTEAVRALLEWGVTAGGINRIQGNADLRNSASLRVMERIGMRRELVMRQVTFFKGAFRDIVFYSYLKEDMARENAAKKSHGTGKEDRPGARGRRRP